MTEEETSATSRIVNIQDVSRYRWSKDDETSQPINVERDMTLENVSMLPNSGAHLGLQENARQNSDFCIKGISIEEYMCMDLSERILDCVDYSRACLQKGKSPAVTSNFCIPVIDPPSKIHQTLQNAVEEGIAHLVWSAPSEECYELGVRPAPVPSGYPYAVIAEPQWWVGRSNAQIRAGPYANKTQAGKARTYRRERGNRQAWGRSRRSSRVNMG